MDISNSLKLKLVLGKPISFDNGFIRQPTIELIDVISEDTFMSYIQPFTLTLDVFGLPKEIENMYTVYELLFFIDDMNKTKGIYNEEDSLVERLKSSLHFFFDTDNVQLYRNNMTFLIDYSIKIDRTNFEDLADLILLITKTNKLKNTEKEQKEFLKDKSEDFKKRYLRHLENRKKYQEKHKGDGGIYKIINTVIHYQNPINYNVEKLTYWQLINTYETLVNKETYAHNVSLLSVVDEKGAKKLDLKHWSEKIKIELN